MGFQILNGISVMGIARRSRCPKGDGATHDGQSRNCSKKARGIVKADITEVIDLNFVLAAAQQVCQREVNYSPQFLPKEQRSFDFAFARPAKDAARKCIRRKSAIDLSSGRSRHITSGLAFRLQLTPRTHLVHVGYRYSFSKSRGS